MDFTDYILFVPMFFLAIYFVAGVSGFWRSYCSTDGCAKRRGKKDGA